MIAVELGIGAAEALSVAGTGTVVGVYAKAAYLRLPGGLLALTTREAPSGPVHARAEVQPSRLRVGDPVVVTRSWLEAGPLLIDLRAPQDWRGDLPAPDAALSVAAALLAQAPHPDLAVDPAMVRAGDLAGLAASLGGVGPGLTPAGDDCLAGILLVARLRWGPLDAGLVHGVETNDIARMYLLWAFRGQSIEPVHRFLLASAAGDVERARTALDDLLGFGHSSGADLAFGLRLGLDLPPVSEQKLLYSNSFCSLPTGGA